MLIRPATLADIPAMMVLERQAPSASHWSSEQYQITLGDRGVSRIALVVAEESILQGFLVARTLDREWEIENVVISEVSRRRGLGTRLLSEIIGLAHSHGVEAVFLEVRESNLPARALYEKFTFAVSGRRAGYYREPEEDAVVYRLTIS